MSTHFSIKYIVSYSTELLLTIYLYYCSNLYFMQPKKVFYTMYLYLSIMIIVHHCIYTIIYCIYYLLYLF